MHFVKSQLNIYFHGWWIRAGLPVIHDHDLDGGKEEKDIDYFPTSPW